MLARTGLGRFAVGVLAVLAVVAATIVVQVVPGGAPQARADGLVPYNDCDDYLRAERERLIAAATAFGLGEGGRGGMAASGTALAMSSGGSVNQTLSASVADAGAGATGTNLQERGVDEPDVAKLADGRIVTVTGSTVRVHTTGAAPAQVGAVSLTEEDFVPYESVELLVVGGRVLAIQNAWAANPTAVASDTSTEGPTNPAGITRPGGDTVAATRMVLIDVTGAKPAVLESATIDGSYVSARLVDGTVRLVTRFQPDLRPVYAIDGTRASARRALAENRRIAGSVGLDELLPRFVHQVGTGQVGSTKREGPAVGCSDIAHPPGRSGNGMLVVSTLRPEGGLAQVDRDAVSSDGELVYASTGRLYVATHQYPAPSRPLPADLAVPDVEPGDPYDPSPGALPSMSSGASPSASTTRVGPPEVSTEVHAFDTTAQRATTYVASGSVSGYVHGRWAFSEHEGVLRVATTRSPNVGTPADGTSGTGVSTSMVVKLREDGDELAEVGRIAGLGRTEEIKSVRYFGELAAVVTFRETDPLYLLDLGDRPRVLGELKIPGFSTYLHPIGDGLLLALGYSATETGAITGAQASVFDIGDPSRPRLVDRYALQGESPAITDSRAFTYDPARRLLVLPVVDWSTQGYPAGRVVGVRVDPGGRFVPAGTATATGRFLGAEGNGITRVLIDGTHYYGVHHRGLLAGDLDTLARPTPTPTSTPTSTP